jgi:hypothetical protein
MSHEDLQGSMLWNTNPAKEYEYFGYLRIGGVDYKLFAFPDARYTDERRWSLKFVRVPAPPRVEGAPE